MENYNDAYRIEELKHKTAETTLKANQILLEARAKELELENLRRKEKDDLTATRKYLLKVNFGGAFADVPVLKGIKDYDELHAKLVGLSKLSKNKKQLLDYYQADGHENNVYKIDTDICEMFATEFLTNYNHFLALGHPGYELSMGRRPFDGRNFLYSDSGTGLLLHHISSDKIEIQEWFTEHLQSAVKQLHYKSYILKK